MASDQKRERGEKGKDDNPHEEATGKTSLTLHNIRNQKGGPLKYPKNNMTLFAMSPATRTCAIFINRSMIVL